MREYLSILIILITTAVPKAIADGVATIVAKNTCTEILTATKTGYLLRAYRKSQGPVTAKQLIFTGVDGRDVYNPTQSFTIAGVRVIAARVEPRDSEVSEVVFFSETNGVWAPLAGAPRFKMQDPFFTFISGQLILGGVEIFQKPEGGLGYKTIFYRGTSLQNLARFTEGPLGMKDIRLVELRDGRIGLFTRPQGKIPGTNIDGGRGKIGFMIINSLEELNAEAISKAPLINGQFTEGEWGGVNEAQLLPEGTIAVLGHIARFDSRGDRHYYPVIFMFDAQTGKSTPLKIILERANLPNGLLGESKRKDLRDVLFSGGMTLSGEKAVIYVGAGDAETYTATLNNPFYRADSNQKF